MSKLTVYTKTYNREKILPKTIESILEQTFEDFEYIIYNNGSTDNTQSVIDKYAEQDSRIKIIRTKDNKLSEEPSEAFRICGDNKYFTLVDDDDYIDKKMVETLYNLIKETDADIASVGSKYVYTDGSMKDKFVFEGEYTFDRIDAMFELLKREKTNSARGGKIYKKQLLDNIDFPNVYPIRDIHREYRVFNRINKLVLTGKPMYYFFRHDSNLSGLDSVETITPIKMQQHLLANHIRTEYLTEKMPEIAEYVLYSEYSFMISLTERIRRLGAEPCYTIADQMSEILRKNKGWLDSCKWVTERETDILQELLKG